jgi:hypothetical protein
MIKNELSSVILKIKKLLRLAEGNKSLNEKTAAFGRARALIEKYNLKEELFTQQPKIIFDSIVDFKKPLLAAVHIIEYEAALANLICEYSDCRCYLTTFIIKNSSNDFSVGEAISVIGCQGDVEFVFTVYAWIMKEIERLSKKLDPLQIEAFALGFIKKVEQKLIKAKESARKEFLKENKNVIIIIDKLNSKKSLIDDYMINLNLSNSSDLNFNDIDLSAFRKGFMLAEAVDLFNLNKLQTQ